MLFAATNRGGQAHLTGELFRDRSKANISFVHAAGAAVSINDVIAGRIPIMFEGLAGMAPGTQSGGIRLLGVAVGEAAAQRAGPADDQRNRAGRGFERLDRDDGAGGRARRYRPEAQQRPAHRRRRQGRDRAIPARSAPIRAISRRPRPASSCATKKSCGGRSCGEVDEQTEANSAALPEEPISRPA